MLPNSEVNPKERYRGGNGENLGLTYLDDLDDRTRCVKRVIPRVRIGL